MTPGATERALRKLTRTFALVQTLQCPYCGEPVELSAEAQGASEETYVEDCSVCCRPWTVHIHRDGEGGAEIVLQRDDE